MSRPRSRMTATASGVGGVLHAMVPAECTRAAAPRSRRCAPSNASAIGDRQMLPVHTTRTPRARIVRAVHCATVSGPLEGIRVVELGVWVAGPAAGGVLADWGAAVVKIEPPDGGPVRGLYPAVAGGE